MTMVHGHRPSSNQFDSDVDGFFFFVTDRKNWRELTTTEENKKSRNSRNSCPGTFAVKGDNEGTVVKGQEAGSPVTHIRPAVILVSIRETLEPRRAD